MQIQIHIMTRHAGRYARSSLPAVAVAVGSSIRFDIFLVAAGMACLLWLMVGAPAVDVDTGTKLSGAETFVPYIARSTTPRVRPIESVFHLFFFEIKP